MTKHGTTPLPINPSVSKVVFDPTLAIGSSSLQQPNTSPVANFTSTPNSHPTGNLLAANASYIVYGVKNGLVRVIDQRSALRTLLRGHNQRISDVAFLGNSSSGGTSGVLGTVGGEGDCSNVLIWRIFKKEEELGSEKLLEIWLKSAARIVWHPFSPNHFMLLHRNGEDMETGSGLTAVASLVDTTKLETVPHEEEGHPVCTCGTSKSGSSSGAESEIGGALKLVVSGCPKGAGINDLCWSERDARHVVTAHNDGCVRLWDLMSKVYVNASGDQIDEKDEKHGNADGSFLLSAKCLMTLRVDDSSTDNGDNGDKSVQRCIFLSRYHDASRDLPIDRSSKTEAGSYFTAPFLTFTRNGSLVSLWSPFSASGSLPTKVRTFEISGEDSNGVPRYNVALCTGPMALPGISGSDALPPSTFVLFAHEDKGDVYALHLSAKLMDMEEASTLFSSEEVKGKMAVVNGFDYVVPFRAVHPIYSWSVASSTSPDNINGQFDIDLFCVQSKAVQLLTLLGRMCIGPPMLEEGSVLPAGIFTVEEAEGTNSIDEDKFEDEEYDLEKSGDNDDAVDYDDYEDDVEDEDDEDSREESKGDKSIGESTNDIIPPLASSLPTSGLGDNTDDITSNSFSNWLGNLPGVQNSIPATPPVTPVIPQKASVPPGLPALSEVPLPLIGENDSRSSSASRRSSKNKTNQRFLSPMEFLASASVKKEEDEVFESSYLGVDNSKEVLDTSSEKFSNEVKEKNLSSKVSKKQNSTPNLNAKIEPTKGLNSNGRSVGKKIRKRSQPVPVPDNDGKISILKREEKSSENVEAPKLGMLSCQPASYSEELNSTIKKSVALQIKNHESQMITHFHKFLQDEIRSNMIPAIENQFSKKFENSMSNQFQAAVANKLKENTDIQTTEMAKKISKNIEESVNTTFNDTFKNILVPSYQNGTQQMCNQLSSSIQAGLASKRETEKDASSIVIESMSKQIDAMSNIIERLSKTVSHLDIGQRDAIPRTSRSVNEDKFQVIRNEISSYLKTGEYEKAFTHALSASDSDMAVFACKNADIATVLEGDTPKLSQPILLCLMQQLGADLISSKDNDLKVQLAWLQNIAVTLDPYNESIKKHVGTVCQQLIENINIKMAQEGHTVRRPLQMLLQVIRGIGTR